MRRRHLGKILFPLLIISLLVSSFYFTALVLKSSAPHQPAAPILTKKIKTTITAPVISINPPTRLEIETISVNSIVKPVGLTSDGDMAIDDNIDDVAWYEPGPKPGERGSAVVAGHYGWKQGQPSVFNNLSSLKAGDIVSVYDAGNKRTSFVVQKIQSYDPAADATEVFLSNDGEAHLNLITCEGVWNSSQRTYSKRLVVFTDKET